MHVHTYIKKQFMFVPQKGKLDPIKELDFFFLNPTLLLFLMALWENFSIEDTLNNTGKKKKSKQTLSPIWLIKSWFSSLKYRKEWKKNQNL